jgi:hypothetical protein
MLQKLVFLKETTAVREAVVKAMNRFKVSTTVQFCLKLFASSRRNYIFTYFSTLSSPFILNYKDWAFYSFCQYFVGELICLTSLEFASCYLCWCTSWGTQWLQCVGVAYTLHCTSAPLKEEEVAARMVLPRSHSQYIAPICYPTDSWYCPS